MTGPRWLTMAEAVAIIAIATNRRIRFEPISVAPLGVQLAEQHVPEVFVSLMQYVFTEVLDGRNAKVGDGVQRA